MKPDAFVVGLPETKTYCGSDKSGVPMRNDIHGARKYVLLSKGVGLQDAEKGQRETMCRNTVSEEIYQINCKFDGELLVSSSCRRHSRICRRQTWR